MRCIRMAGVVLGLLMLPAVSHALVVNGENAENHYRFEAGTYPSNPVPNGSPNFIAAGFDLSGVGWGSNPSQSFTMICDQYFVFATHYPPPNSTIYFYSPTKGVVSYTIDTSFNLPLEYPLAAEGNHLKSDLSIGRLTTPLNPDDEITFYPILNLPDQKDYLNLDLLVYGKDAAVGTGRLGGIVSLNLYSNAGTPGRASDDVLNSGSNSDNLPDTLAMYYIRGAGTNSALLEVGDSGSPTFAIVDGSLALVGIHSAVAGSINYDVFLPAYLGSLQSAGIFSTVPEPSVIWLAGGGWLFMVSRRGRRGAR